MAKAAALLLLTLTCLNFGAIQALVSRVANPNPNPSSNTHTNPNLNPNPNPNPNPSAEFGRWAKAWGIRARKVEIREQPLRGLYAAAKIAAGEAMVEVPYDALINLGSDAVDVTKGGQQLLAALTENQGDKYRAYWNILPSLHSSECTTTDFMTDVELGMLQCPYINAQVSQRKAVCKERCERSAAWMEPRGLGETDLAWATWMVMSRAFTALAADEEPPVRVMAPFMDMANHLPGSKHTFKGRAIPGNVVRLVAGTDVKKNEQICIDYSLGGGGSEYFIQHYGFVDEEGCRANDMRQLRALPVMGQMMDISSVDDDVSQLEGIEQASRLASGAEAIAYKRQMIALQFRIAMKRAKQRVSSI